MRAGRLLCSFGQMGLCVSGGHLYRNDRLQWVAVILWIVALTWAYAEGSFNEFDHA